MLRALTDWVIRQLTKPAPPRSGTGGWGWGGDSNENTSLISETKDYVHPPKEYRMMTSTYGSAPISEWWGDCFESVFISFKPFLDCSALGYKPAEFYEAIPDGPERRFIYKRCKPVSWETAKERLGFKDNKELAIELFRYYTSQYGVNHKLDVYLSPQQHEFALHHTEKILTSLGKMGYKQASIGSEFPGVSMPAERSMDTVESAIESFLIWYGYVNIYPQDRKWLLSNPYDTFYTCICGTGEMVERLVDENNLEGFYADEKTTFSWWEETDASA